jgi:hypothetical protein
MFLSRGGNIKGIEIRIILNDPTYSLEHIVTLLEIARTYYQCTTIRLDVSGYQVSAEDALVILDTMDLFRTQYGVSFHTEASKTISFPGAYILIFGDIGHRTLHANANIVRQLFGTGPFFGRKTSGRDREHLYQAQRLPKRTL